MTEAVWKVDLSKRVLIIKLSPESEGHTTKKGNIMLAGTHGWETDPITGVSVTFAVIQKTQKQPQNFEGEY